jgi:hypothetical protein
MDGGRMTKIFTFLVGQSCRSARNFWAAQQRRSTDDVKVFVVYPAAGPQLDFWTIPGSAVLPAKLFPSPRMRRSAPARGIAAGKFAARHENCLGAEKYFTIIICSPIVTW